MNQIIRGKRKDGAEQYRRERHILGRIVDDFQKRRKGTYMGGIQQIGSGIGKYGDAPGTQGCLVGGEISAASQQDAEVAVITRAGSIPLPYREGFLLELLDALSHGAGISIGISAVHHGEFADPFIIGIASHHKALAVAVIDAAKPSREDMLKEIVGPCNDIGGTAEIGVQGNGCRT